MKSALLAERDGLRTFLVVMTTGDEVMTSLSSFASAEHLGSSHFTAIGAFSRAVVAYFEWPAKRYLHVAIGDQVEVLSCLGDITIEDPGPRVHSHVVLGKANASAYGGHLIEAFVRPTFEIVLTETPRHLHRRFDPTSGLALIDPDRTDAIGA